VRYLSIFQVAAKVNVSTMTIRRWWASGRMPKPSRPGGKLLRWNEQEIDDWLSGSKEPEQAPQEQEA